MKYLHPSLRYAALWSALALPVCLAAQEQIPANVHVTDARLTAAMERLLAGSPSARDVVADLSASGLVVSIGSPAELAALAETEGGPLPSERVGLLSAQQADVAPVAWVMLRVLGERAGTVERAWVVIDVDAMEARIGVGAKARAALEQDLLAALAHEFVAHIGSVARSRSLDDFCDDPTPASQAIDPLGCSIRVENQVRRELNRGLGLRGSERLAERTAYSLDVMNFAGPR